jgi:hypothetical protein
VCKQAAQVPVKFEPPCTSKLSSEDNEELSDGLGQQASFTSICYHTHTSSATYSALKFALMRTRAFDEPDVMGKCADETS